MPDDLAPDQATPDSSASHQPEQPDTDRPAPDQSSAWRDHLANERTYLSWLRAALGVLALGLAAARFGGRGGLAAGAILTAAAVGGLVFGAVRYRRSRRAITTGELPGGSGTAPVVAGVALVATFLLAFLVLELAG